MVSSNDINVNLSEIIKELKSLSHNATEEVLLIIITAIILVIILIQRIYHCYALVCKNNNPEPQVGIADQQLIVGSVEGVDGVVSGMSRRC